MPATPSPLLSLPPELRHKIYTLALSPLNPQPKTLSLHISEHGTKPSMSKPDILARPQDRVDMPAEPKPPHQLSPCSTNNNTKSPLVRISEPSLSRVCHSVRLEVLCIIYKHSRTLNLNLHNCTTSTTRQVLARLRRDELALGLTLCNMTFAMPVKKINKNGSITTWMVEILPSLGWTLHHRLAHGMDVPGLEISIPGVHS